jgi:hypothetical protein
MLARHDDSLGLVLRCLGRHQRDDDAALVDTDKTAARTELLPIEANKFAPRVNRRFMPSLMDGRQLSAARALAELTVDELAGAASVTKGTVNRLETGGELHVAEKRRHGHVSREIWDRIVAALKRHGVELLPETEEHGAGVRWTLPRARRPKNWP